MTENLRAELEALRGRHAETSRLAEQLKMLQEQLAGDVRFLMSSFHKSNVNHQPVVSSLSASYFHHSDAASPKFANHYSDGHLICV